MTMAPQRVSVSSDAKMVNPRNPYATVDAPAEPSYLYGWAHPPLGPVMSVVLDDGRELLIARKDLVRVKEWTGWDESEMQGVAS